MSTHPFDTDRRFIHTLGELVAGSARKLDLDYKQLEVKRLPRRNYPYRGVAQADYGLQGILLSIRYSYLKRAPHLVLTAIVEHEMCRCKDRAEGVYGSEIFLIGQSPRKAPYQPMALELYNAYTDYFSSMRQIAIFGNESFITYHAYRLEDFLTRTDFLVGIGEKAKSANKRAISLWQHSAVMALFKEYIMSELYGYRSEAMKQPITEMAMALRDCFDVIHSTETDWVDKTRLLFYTGMALNAQVDIVNSYTSGALVTRASGGGLDTRSIVELLEFDDDSCYRAIDGIDERLHRLGKR